MTKPTTTISVTARIDEGLAARLDAAVDVLAARIAGLKLNRSDVMRIALERGLEVIESERKSKR